MQKQIQVRYSNRGLANFYENHIEINENLKNDKVLRDYIVKHELGHIHTFDIAHEFKDGLYLAKNPKIMKKIILFYLKNPSTWKDLSPIWLSNKKIIYDLNLCFLYGLIGIALFILIKIF